MTIMPSTTPNLAAMAVLLVLLTFLSALPFMLTPAAAQESGQEAAQETAGPDFTLPELGSQKLHRLQDYRGKVVYLDFWASWCGPCRQSMPLYQTLYQEFNAGEFALIAINVDEELADAEAFLQSNPVTYTILLDPDGISPADWRVRVMPSSFLLDRSGTIIKQYAGFEPSHIEEIRHDIQALLAR